MKYVAVFATLLLCVVGNLAQQNSQEPDLKMDKVATIVVSYSKEHRIGQILTSNEEDQIDQYFDVGGKSKNDHSPVLITYAFAKRDSAGKKFYYTATWGKGAVDRSWFQTSCLSDVPDFKDDVHWAAIVVGGKLQFEPIEDKALKEAAIKVLFRSVKGTVHRWVFESARPVISSVPYDDQRILIDLVNRNENRKIWYSKGWLRPENRCVRYLQTN